MTTALIYVIFCLIWSGLEKNQENIPRYFGLSVLFFFLLLAMLRILVLLAVCFLKLNVVNNAPVIVCVYVYVYLFCRMKRTKL